MSRYSILLRLFVRPQRHTWFFMVATTILTASFLVNLSTMRESIMTAASLAMIFIAASSMTINEILFGLADKKRDVALLLAVGVPRLLIGLTLFAKAIIYASICCLLGATLGNILLLSEGGPTIILPSLSLILPSVVVLGPALLAGSYGIVYTFRLNVPEALRQ